MKLDKNVAILASAAIAYVAQNSYDITEDFDSNIIEQLQNIASASDFVLEPYQGENTNEDYVKAIISAVEYLQICAEEYEALEREVEDI